MTTTGTTARNFPMIPSPQISGRNAATVVLTLPKTGHMTSRAPRTEASTALSPWLYRRKTFSPMTMASSTTMPSAMIMPKSESILMVKPPR